MLYIKNLDSDGMDTSMLIIEDSPVTREIMVQMLQKEYPLMTIDAPKNFFEQDYVALFKRNYTYILLDTFLGRWGSHPLFGEWGENIIPYIKEFSATTKIIATADTADENAIMTAKGVYDTILKHDFLEARYGRESRLAMHPPSSEKT